MKLKKSLTRLEQLRQIAEIPIWDGDLISKSETDELHKSELIDRAHGFSFITGKGVGLLRSLGKIQY